LNSGRTEARASKNGRRWAACASKGEIADIRCLAQGDGPITLGGLRAIVDPHGDLLGVEVFAAVGYTLAHDPDIYATAFVRAAAEPSPP
jgi:hypothetical protein